MPCPWPFVPYIFPCTQMLVFCAFKCQSLAHSTARLLPRAQVPVSSLTHTHTHTHRGDMPTVDWLDPLSVSEIHKLQQQQLQQQQDGGGAPSAPKSMLSQVQGPTLLQPARRGEGQLLHGSLQQQQHGGQPLHGGFPQQQQQQQQQQCTGPHLLVTLPSFPQVQTIYECFNFYCMGLGPNCFFTAFLTSPAFLTSLSLWAQTAFSLALPRQGLGVFKWPQSE